jgi:hypothetical protein
VRLAAAVVIYVRPVIGNQLIGGIPKRRIIGVGNLLRSSQDAPMSSGHKVRDLAQRAPLYSALQEAEVLRPLP